VQLKPDARIGFPVSAEYAGQICQHARSDKTDVERTHFPAADAAGLLDIPLYVAQRAAGALQKRLPGGRQTYGSGRPREEWIAQHLFELANLLGERWLTQVQPLRRASEMQLFRNGYEVPEMAQFDISIHISTIIIEWNKILDISYWNGQTA
jgi:hypothetical protein